jgi:hypothetical protein
MKQRQRRLNQANSHGDRAPAEISHRPRDVHLDTAYLDLKDIARRSW